MYTKTTIKFIRSIVFSTMITLLLLFSVLNSYITHASDSALVGAVVPGKVNNNGIIIISNDPSIFPSSSITASPLDKNYPIQNGISEDKNPIIKTIESGIDFLLPRTGGQSRIITISLFLSFVGLWICASSFWKKN
jgi:hypothetical protein